VGFTFTEKGFSDLISKLSLQYRIYAPVLKKGAGRFTDTDSIFYEFVTDASSIELERKSEYSFKDVLVPLSKTLFYFAEDEMKPAGEGADGRDILVFARSCDMHALKRQDAIYLENGAEKDFFYERIREKLKFVLIGCTHDQKDCFCVSMGTNKTDDGYLFSVEKDPESGRILSKLADDSLADLFRGACEEEKDVVPSFVTENETKVNVPENIPLSIVRSNIWDEYNERCFACGRCTIACPTCTCFSIEDIYYTDNGDAGERRRVQASCMIDGYTNVAGGGQYRRTKGERMRFKTLHKIKDFRSKFGYNMCVGCGRCTTICPMYISFPEIINKVDKTVKEEAEGGAEA